MQTSAPRRQAGVLFGLFMAGALLFGLSFFLDWNRVAAGAGLTDKVAAYGRQFTLLSALALWLTALLYALHKRNPRLLPADVWCESKWPPYLLAAAIIAYIAAFALLVSQRHIRFNSAVYDLGLQSQVVWNTSRGNWFASSVEVSNYMGDHFQPLIAVLAPLYRISPSVYWLLAFQTIVLALGAIPAYRLAKRHLGCASYGLLFGVVYLLYPPVGYINRFDFHWEAVVIPLLLAAIDAVDRRRWRWASLWLLLALLSKEEIGLTIAAFGLWIAWQRDRRFGLTWFAVGLSYSLVTLLGVIPAIRGGSSDTLARYMWLGSTPAEMARNALTHPLWLAPRLLGVDAIRLALSLTAPLLFLPFLSSLSAVAIPALTYNLLSDTMAQRVAYYQYMAPIVPMIFAGSVYGMGRILAWARRRNAAWVAWSVCAGMLIFSLWHAAIVNNPLVDDGSVEPAWLRQPNEQAVREALALIPPEAAVLTTNAYGAHLAHRQNLQALVDPQHVALLDDVEYALFNTADYRSHLPWDCRVYAKLLEEAIRLGYGLRFYENDVIVIQRHGGDAQQLAVVAASLCQ